MKSKHVNIVTKAIYQEWFLRFGFLKHICYVVHDNGLEFVNKWNKALFEIINVKSMKTSVYNPSSSAQVTNKYLLSILRKLTIDEPKKWSTLIPSVVMAINNSVIETTKFMEYT